MIYKATWYNESKYGKIDGISIVVDSNKPCGHPKIWEQAIETLRSHCPTLDFNSYEKTKMIDITKEITFKQPLSKT